MTLENSAHHHAGTIPAPDAHDRAPSHKKPKLPPIEDIAAVLRSGENLEALAVAYDRVPDTLRLKLNRGGFSVSGDPITRRSTVLTPVVGDFDDQPWADRALCIQTDPEAFFPEKGGTTLPAKRVCLSCEVRPECLQYALTGQERFGIWGGLSERERRQLLKDRKTA